MVSFYGSNWVGRITVSFPAPAPNSAELPISHRFSYPTCLLLIREGRRPYTQEQCRLAWAREFTESIQEKGDLGARRFLKRLQDLGFARDNWLNQLDSILADVEWGDNTDYDLTVDKIYIGCVPPIQRS